MYKRYNFEHTIGSISEIKTARYLQDVCDMSIVRNVYIPSRTGNTEIDIIGLNERGIFVIENKSYGGDVYGSVRDDYWSVVYQSINPDYSGNTYNMKNPVFQNRYHVEELLFMLDRSGFKDISVKEIEKQTEPKKNNLRPLAKARGRFLLFNFRIISFSFGLFPPCFQYISNLRFGIFPTCGLGYFQLAV